METYRDLIMALAKVIIGVAWADHELDEEEIEIELLRRQKGRSKKVAS